MVRRVRAVNIPQHIILEVSHREEPVGAVHDKLNNYLIVGASESGKEAHVGVSGIIEGSKIVGATKGEKADVGLADNMSDSVIIGGTEGKNAAVGWAEETLKDSVVIGSAHGNRSNIAHADEALSDSLVIGSTTGAKSYIAFSAHISNCLILGSAMRGDVARAATIQSSLIIADGGEKRVARASELTDTLVLNLRQETATYYDKIGQANEVTIPRYHPTSRYLTRLGRTGLGGISDFQMKKIGELTAQLTGEANLTNRMMAANNGEHLFLKDVTSGEIRFTRNFAASHTEVRKVHGLEFQGVPIYRPGETVLGTLQEIGMHKTLSCILSIPTVKKYIPLSIKELLVRPVFRKRVSVKERFRRRWF